jgi:hypothetical protein
MLGDDQSCRAHGSLAIVDTQEVRGPGGTLEHAPDHGFALFQCCLVQFIGEVGGGVVVEGTDVPGVRVSPHTVIWGSSH